MDKQKPLNLTEAQQRELLDALKVFTHSRALRAWLRTHDQMAFRQAVRAVFHADGTIAELMDDALLDGPPNPAIRFSPGAAEALREMSQEAAQRILDHRTSPAFSSAPGAPKVLKHNGRYYINMGLPGFNSNANNGQGYETHAQAWDVIHGKRSRR